MYLYGFYALTVSGTGCGRGLYDSTISYVTSILQKRASPCEALQQGMVCVCMCVLCCG